MRASWIIVIGLLLLGYGAFAHGDYDGHMGGWPMMGGGMWCFIFWVVVAIAVLILIVLAVRYLTARGTAGKAEKSSLEILKERYAKGEISKAEFEEMKRDLES
ncbi:MAG TPA: SHOCT domain-containing protein [bacterium]|nr:SHOCT domain-containing protein [bacterium]